MNKALFFTIVAIVIVGAGGLFLLYGNEIKPESDVAGVGNEVADTSDTLSTTPSPAGSPSGTITPVEEPKDLKIEDTTVGTGAEATPDKKLTVKYKGMLTNGAVFDSGEYAFTPNEGGVIQGWIEGFNGMKIGGKRKLTIPSRLGYGERGAGAQIPPNSTLIFEVELLKVE